ncbi:UNVERIFIED_CONTAM: hypothetical protein NCL1_14656 [Trichonephila clavipes]
MPLKNALSKDTSLDFQDNRVESQRTLTPRDPVRVAEKKLTLNIAKKGKLKYFILLKIIM